MKTLVFTKENKDIWFILYSAFSQLSTNTLTTMEQFDIAYNVLRKLQSVAVITNENAQMTYRSLQENGGEITLEDREFDYLKKSIYPPSIRWEHKQLEYFACIKEFLDSC